MTTGMASTAPIPMSESAPPADRLNPISAQLSAPGPTTRIRTIAMNTSVVTASDTTVPSGPPGSIPRAEIGTKTMSVASSVTQTTAPKASTGDGPRNGSDGRRMRSVAWDPAAASSPSARTAMPTTNSQRAAGLRELRIEIVTVPAPTSDRIHTAR
jgi:hypothetical protein